MKSAVLVEEKCQACDGAGHQAVKQPSQPNRRIYPPPSSPRKLSRRDMSRSGAGKSGVEGQTEITRQASDRRFLDPERTIEADKRHRGR